MAREIESDSEENNRSSLLNNDNVSSEGEIYELADLGESRQSNESSNAENETPENSPPQRPPPIWNKQTISHWCCMLSSLLFCTISFICCLMHVALQIRYISGHTLEYLYIFLDISVLLNSLIIIHQFNPFSERRYAFTTYNFIVCAVCAVWKLLSICVIFSLQPDEMMKVALISVGTLVCVLFVPKIFMKYIELHHL